MSKELSTRQLITSQIIDVTTEPTKAVTITREGIYTAFQKLPLQRGSKQAQHWRMSKAFNPTRQQIAQRAAWLRQQDQQQCFAR